MGKKLLTALGMTLLVIICILVFNNFLMRSFSEPIDMYGDDFTSAENYVNKRVKGDLPFSAGQFSWETTTTYIKGITKKDESYYYAIPVKGKNPQYLYFIAAKVDEKEMNIYERATAAFYSDTNITYSYPIEGTIKKLDNKTYEYMLSYFRDIYPELSESELREHILPYGFYPETYKYIELCIALIIIVILSAVLYWIYFFVCLFKPKKAKTTNVSESYTYQSPAEIISAARHASENDVKNDYAYNNGAFTYTNTSSKPESNSKELPEGEVIFIDNIPYSKDDLSTVNQLLNNGEKGKAIIELSKITNFDLATASRVIDNWNSYFTY